MENFKQLTAHIQSTGTRPPARHAPEQAWCAQCHAPPSVQARPRMSLHTPYTNTRLNAGGVALRRLKHNHNFELMMAHDWLAVTELVRPQAPNQLT